jgi:hypothetical protein
LDQPAVEGHWINDVADADELDRAMEKGLRGTEDKYITAEFTGIFRCVPSCAATK